MAQLKRSLGLWGLIAYGVGDILGAGIYALVGKVAGLVGPGAWISFVISLVVASLTAFSLSELASRFPRSAGEAVYAMQAFKRPSVSYLMGFLVLLSGISSMATVSHAFAGYLHVVFPGMPTFLIIFLFFGILACINFWGMSHSSLTNIVCTVIEVVGIGLVIIAGMKFFGRVDYLALTPPQGMTSTNAILQGSIFAFYAFIGFEDIINVAEETHHPEKTIPRAILTSLVVIAVIYILTAVAAVSAVSIPELAASNAPLILVVQKGFQGFPTGVFSLIALFAVTNTALVNFIMSSRILYGMANEKLAPAIFSQVHPKRQTPHRAILAIFFLAMVLAFSGTLVILAQSTSLLLLTVFFIMNLSLIVIKSRDKTARPAFQVPMIVPILGMVCCLGLMLYVKKEAFVIVAFLALLGTLLYGTPKLKKVKKRTSS